MYTLTTKENVVVSLSDLVNLYRNVYELWVFGYASILWKPGITYKRREVGKIHGYVRRFWQGNVTHRGTPEHPGRVATLVEEPKGEVWGMSFQLVGRTMIKKGLRHLGIRECALGGYTATLVSCESHGADGQTTPRTVLVFSATPENPYYMGPAPVEDMANQIIACVGRTGHNVEYVTRLADFMRRHIPEDQDSHLFDLDLQLRQILTKNQMWLQTVLHSTNRKDTKQLRSIMNQQNDLNNTQRTTNL